MRVRMPASSMPALVAVGCLIVALPLLASTLFSLLTLQQVSLGIRTVLEQEFTATQIGMRLRNQTIDLERSIRQYQVLKSPKLLPVVDNHWSQTDALITRLNGLHRNNSQQTESLKLRHDFNQARQSWKLEETNDAATQVTMVKRIQALEDVVESILESNSLQIDVQSKHLLASTKQARIRIILSAVGLLLLGSLLAWAFIRVVTTPLLQLMRAIVDLRRGNYQSPVVISFPSEFRRVGQRLDWLRQRLSKLEADKDQFLRQVSHEFKTPLASLREGTELLSGGAIGELRPSQAEVVEIMDESSRELESLIDNLLAYAEWRAERQFTQEQWFDARELLDEVLASHRLPMTKRKLTVKLQARAKSLFGRRTQLRVALDNLVTNAIKHAPVNSTIEFEVEDDAKQFVVTVRDWGCGVPDAEKDAIFKPFSRGVEIEEQGIRGTGVGLAIVLETIRAHGGSVSVEDAFPGARFRLVWPNPAT